MKQFTMKTNKADLLISANELLERQRILFGLLIITFSIGVLFWIEINYYYTLFYIIYRAEFF